MTRISWLIRSTRLMTLPGSRPWKNASRCTNRDSMMPRRTLEWWEREEQARLSLEASGFYDDLPEPEPVAEMRWLDEHDPNSGSETQKDWRPEDLR